MNLECCVSGQESPTGFIRAKRFYVRAPPSAVDCLQAMGARVAGLANNHALDFGADALADALGHLRAAGIAGRGGDRHHSAHVFDGVALTPAGPVMYDLGGALDDYAIDGELRNDLGVLARWRTHTEPEIELIGLRAGFCRTELAVGADAKYRRLYWAPTSRRAAGDRHQVVLAGERG